MDFEDVIFAVLFFLVIGSIIFLASSNNSAMRCLQEKAIEICEDKGLSYLEHNSEGFTCVDERVQKEMIFLGPEKRECGLG